mmetsp:Transcript_10895/g.25320  ORF Transcript_10895/g.25320 Transcript_10895/m.25320 type:complete len:204 (+) Transcript_10895:843-1454(+)
MSPPAPTPLPPASIPSATPSLPLPLPIAFLLCPLAGPDLSRPSASMRSSRLPLLPVSKWFSPIASSPNSMSTTQAPPLSPLAPPPSPPAPPPPLPVVPSVRSFTSQADRSSHRMAISTARSAASCEPSSTASKGISCEMPPPEPSAMATLRHDSSAHDRLSPIAQALASVRTSAGLTSPSASSLRSCAMVCSISGRSWTVPTE